MTLSRLLRRLRGSGSSLCHAYGTHAQQPCPAPPPPSPPQIQAEEPDEATTSGDGTLRTAPAGHRRGDTSLTIFIDKWGFKEAAGFYEPRVVVSVRDEFGENIEAVQVRGAGREGAAGCVCRGCVLCSAWRSDAPGTACMVMMPMPQGTCHTPREPEPGCQAKL